jgi:methyl-accepting chemotaxis protein
MAIRITSIVKAIAPLIEASSGLAGLLGERIGQNRNLGTEDRIKKLEEDLIKMGEVLSATVGHLQTTAQALREQVERYESQRARLRMACIFSVLALGMSAVALILALVH